MSAFTYPGVYIEEISSGVHTITGVATSIAAFVGWAPQGPVTQATLVESWSEFQTLFGGLDSRSLLGYSVNQFFANGGQQAYIVRLVWDGSVAAAPGTSPAPSATAVAAGVGFAVAAIQAAIGSISGQTTLSVGTPVLQSIAITPATIPPIPIGLSVQLSATGSLSNGSTQALAGATWTSSNPSVISVAAGGLATASGAGTAIVTATSGLVSGSIPVTATAATLTGITVAPTPPPLAAGESQQLTATANYSDGTTQDLTPIAAWASSVPADATVGSAGVLTSGGLPTIPGLVTAVSAGASNITATWAGQTSAPVAVTVLVKAMTSITIFPASPTLQTGQTTTFSAIANFSDGTSAALAGETWTSSNLAVATVVPATGVATAAGVGSTTITATSGSISASTTLTVTAATLNSISVTPTNPSVAKSLTQQMKATGIYSDGTTADLTGSAAWTTSNAADATVTPDGLVTGVAAATTATITATWQGDTANTTVTITAPALQSIAVTPASPSILSGQTQQFKATGTYSDASTQDVTLIATWTSSAPTSVTVNSTGLAKAIAAGGSLTLFASNPGQWGNTLRVGVSVQAPPNNNRFNLLVQQINPKGQLQTLESFANLSVSPTDPQYVVTVVDNDSSYITFINPGTGTPVVPTATPSPTPLTSPAALSGGADGAVLVPASDQNFELALTSNATAGVFLLDRVDIFNLLCIPAETDAPTIQTLQEYCHTKRAFYIVDSPEFTTTSHLISSGPVGTTPGSLTEQYSINSAYYFPWVVAPDPLFGNRATLFPPCGFVAGIYAATDANPGVWKAPAGINAGLTGVSGLQYNLTDLENGSLNVQAINCLRQFKVYGDVVWGARTLQGSDQAGSEWKYIPIRRLALFLESSLYNGTQWVVFEPNAEPLWSQIRLNVGAFMQGLFLKGAFAGTTPHQAYFVKCDAENNPPASVALGVVNILVGFAPLYPAEFVVIQIQQIAGQSS